MRLCGETVYPKRNQTPLNHPKSTDLFLTALTTSGLTLTRTGHMMSHVGPAKIHQRFNDQSDKRPFLYRLYLCNGWRGTALL